MDIAYTANFLRQYKKLPKELKEEVKRAIGEFRYVAKHKSLHLHKLKGELKSFHSFSVNYRYRIFFEFVHERKTAWLHAVGDHDIYQ